MGITIKLRWIISIAFYFCLFLLPYSSFSQAAYHGGTGDGHGHAVIKNVFVASRAEITKNKISVYPNPVSTTSNLFIELNSSAELILFNSNGNLILIQELSQGKNTLNLNDLSAGVYIAELKSNGFIEKRKLIVIE